MEERKEEHKEERIKDMECISCEKMFDCIGKPRGVNCNSFVQRKDIDNVRRVRI